MMVGVLFGEKIGDKFGKFFPDPGGDALIAAFNPTSQKSLGGSLRALTAFPKTDKPDAVGLLGGLLPPGSTSRRQLLR